MPTRASWDNPDGLTVYFGKRYTENNIASVAANPGNSRKVVQVYVRGEDIRASVADAATLAADPREVVIPSGAYLESAVLLVDELFASGGAATLDIGLTSTAGVVADMNGVDAAIALATLTAGADIASDGALVGTKLAANYKVVFGYNTAAFTAGSARLVLTYIDPPVQTS